MSKIVWDDIGEKKYEYGVSHGVYYELNASNVYATGYAWNGLREVQNNPEGGEANEIWADNIKYATLRGAENEKGSISAYTYPPEMEQANGRRAPVAGMSITGQARGVFGMCYRTEIGSDTNPERGYKLHLLYGVTMDPSDETHETANDNPEAQELSWDYSATPVPVTGYKPTAHVIIDSTTVSSSNLTNLEDALYGTANSAAYLPTPDQVIVLLGGTIPSNG